MAGSATPPVAPPGSSSASSSTTQVATPSEDPPSPDENRHASQQVKTEDASPGRSTPLHVKDEILIRQFETSCGKIPAENTAKDLRSALMRTYGHDFPLDFVTDIGFEMQFYGISKISKTPTWMKWMCRRVVEFRDAEAENCASEEEGPEEGEDADSFNGDAMAESIDDLILILTIPPDLILALAEAGLIQKWFLNQWSDIKEYISRPEPIRPNPRPDMVDYLLLMIPSQVYKLLCDKNILHLDYQNCESVRKGLEMREAACGLEPWEPDWSDVQEQVKRARARGNL